MIGSLLTSEAHQDPYTWAAVLLAHAAIGLALWLVLGRVWRVALLYAAFEIVQAISSSWLIWDSLLDWTAVVLGALIASALRNRGKVRAGVAALAVAVIAITGIFAREGCGRGRR